MILASSSAPTLPPSSASSSSSSSSSAIPYPSIPSPPPPPSHSRVEDFGLSRPKPSCGCLSLSPPAALFASHGPISPRSRFSLSLSLSCFPLTSSCQCSCTSSLLRALFVPSLKRYEWPATGERCIHENEKLSRPARPSVRPFVHFSRPGKTLSIVSLFVRGGRASSLRARLPPSSFYSTVRLAIVCWSRVVIYTSK